MGDLDLPALVSVAGAAVDGHMLRELRERGFTGLKPRHGYVIQRLVAGPDTASSIARVLGVSQVTVATIVRELVALGYVERIDAELDRRGRPIGLTERGEALVQATAAAWERLDLRLRDAVGAAQAERSVDTVRALLRLLEVEVAVEEWRVPIPEDRS